LIGLPNQAADQPFLSTLVQRLGAGRALDGEADEGAIRGAVRDVLANPSYAAAARRLGAAIRASSGPIGAAVELERAIEERRC
jgi:UDP:flavonoid glycosyltransferase YjiC (YdhE family)